jgi:hypothetical protein
MLSRPFTSPHLTPLHFPLLTHSHTRAHHFQGRTNALNPSCACMCKYPFPSSSILAAPTIQTTKITPKITLQTFDPHPHSPPYLPASPRSTLNDRSPHRVVRHELDTCNRRVDPDAQPMTGHDHHHGDLPTIQGEDQ